MSLVSAELVAIIARKLFQKYKSSDSDVGDLLLQPNELADALSKLINDGKLVLGDVTEAAEFRPELVETVVEGIKRIQANKGILKTDGVLGRRTLDAIFGGVFGHKTTPKESLPKSNTTSTPNDVIHALRYHVESLPEVPGENVVKLLRTAWQSWFLVCNIDIKQTENRADANVIVNCKVLNEGDSVLATADVGPPDGRQLELSFSKSKAFTRHKFLATAVHEMGHNLGLGHISTPGQIMNDTLHDDIEAPQTADIAEAVKIWGARV